MRELSNGQPCGNGLAYYFAEYFSERIAILISKYVAHENLCDSKEDGFLLQPCKFFNFSDETVGFRRKKRLLHENVSQQVFGLQCQKQNFEKRWKLKKE